MTGRWFSPGTLVSSTNKIDCHDITEILLKVALNTINLTYSEQIHLDQIDFFPNNEILCENCGISSSTFL